MMKSFGFFIFFSVLLMGKPESSIASDSFSIHTHTSALELKPASFSGAYKTASVCFLGFGECDSEMDYTIDTANQCKNEGFINLNCNSVQEPIGICPYNSDYGKGCVCKSGLITCPSGQVGSGDSCGGQYASCQCVSGVSTGGYGCKIYYDYPCNSVCKVANTDNCHIRSSVSTPYGCQSYWADCPSKCQVAKGNPDCDVSSMSCDYGCSTTNSCGKCTDCKGNADCDVASMSCDHGCSTTNSCGKCTACKGNPDCNVASQTCSYGCANTNSCGKCTDCKGNADCDVASQTCPYGCANTNSCGKCTACAGNADCDVTSQTCSYGCANTNSCGKCTACKGNADCDVASQTCPYGCANSNSCGKCTACKANPCDSVTAVTVPSNATCSSYASTCSSKCAAWSCNSGYNKSGNSCIAAGCTYTRIAANCLSACYDGLSSNSCVRNGVKYHESCTDLSCNGSEPFCYYGSCVECLSSSDCPSAHQCNNNSCVIDLDDNCDGNGFKQIVCDRKSNQALLACCPSGTSCSNLSGCKDTYIQYW